MALVSPDPHDKGTVCRTDNTSRRTNFMKEDSPVLGEDLELG